MFFLLINLSPYSTKRSQLPCYVCFVDIRYQSRWSKICWIFFGYQVKVWIERRQWPKLSHGLQRKMAMWHHRRLIQKVLQFWNNFTLEMGQYLRKIKILDDHNCKHFIENDVSIFPFKIGMIFSPNMSS